MQHSSEASLAPKGNNSWIVVALIILLSIAGIAYYLTADKNTETQPESVVETPIEEPIVEIQTPPVPEIIESTEELPDLLPVEQPITEVIEAEPVNPLPLLNESDNRVKEMLTSLTWRKELLKLVIDDDMVRRLVVFTDNFSQGIVAYEHSPLAKPPSKFEAVLLENGSQSAEYAWDENSSKRFKLYVDLLRSFEVESLVDWYIELQPLINEAYAELGYEGDDFTETMQDAINRVLDMDIPKEELVLIRPSVMYKFKSEEFESMSDTDKLLLRLGKENLLVIKSVLLEFSEKLGRRRGE